MDDTWGLTWSERWHKIDEDRTARERTPGAPAVQAISHCGAWLYRQVVVREKGPRHLKAIVEDDTQAAGVCKRCQRAVSATV